MASRLVLRYILGRGEDSMNDGRGRCSDDPQLGQGRQDPVMDQQVTGQREDGAAEQLGIAHVQDGGEHRQVLPRDLAEHHVAGVAAADQHEVMRGGRSRVVTVEFQFRPGQRALDDTQGRR